MAEDQPKEVPYNEMTREQRKEYQERLKRAAKGPKLAELQIKALDELVAGLKKKRRQVAEQIEADRAEIAAIEREQAEIHKKYDPMAERMRDRQAKRDALVAQLEACKRHMNTIMTETRDSIRKVRSTTGRLHGNDARQKLKDARGYSMGSHRSTRKGRRS